MTKIVVVGDGSAAAVLTNCTTPYEVVASEDAARSAIARFGPDLVAFDMVQVGDDTFLPVREGRPAVSLSPVFSHQRHVDMSFSRTKYDPDAEILSHPDQHRRGLEYTIVGTTASPLSHADYVSNLYGDTLSIGVSMGGADAANQTLEVLRELGELSMPLLVWVMLGEGYAHSYEQLVEGLRRQRHHEIILAKTTRSMWTVLNRSSVVILAGGVTTYEAAYMGMPSINLLRVPEHRFLLRELEEAGAVLCVDGTGSHWGEELRNQLERVGTDRDSLFWMHRRCREQVDGLGAQRVAKELLSLTDK